MTDKKVLFLDMDGTTLDDKQRISEENTQALRRVAQAGHEVVIATGRTYSSAAYLRKHYGLDRIGCRYMIVCNGAAILDCETGEFLFSRTLPLEHAYNLIDAARREGVYLHTYASDKVLTEQDDENLAHYISRTNMEVLIVPDLKAALKAPPYKMLGINVHEQKALCRFRDMLSGWSEDKVDMYFSCAEYLEFVPKGISKGAALRIFCERMDIPAKNTVAAGDENNDISMIKAAGVGCAVANASENVKASADYVTVRDHNHSAVAEIAERFMLDDG